MAAGLPPGTRAGVAAGDDPAGRADLRRGPVRGPAGSGRLAAAHRRRRVAGRSDADRAAGHGRLSDGLRYRRDRRRGGRAHAGRRSLRDGSERRGMAGDGSGAVARRRRAPAHPRPPGARAPGGRGPAVQGADAARGGGACSGGRRQGPGQAGPGGPDQARAPPDPARLRRGGRGPCAAADRAARPGAGEAARARGRCRRAAGERPPAGVRARGFRRQGGDHPGAAGPGGHALRAGAGAGHEILARDRPRRRRRALDERGLGAHRRRAGAQRHRHRAAQSRARDGLAARTPGIDGL